MNIIKSELPYRNNNIILRKKKGKKFKILSYRHLAEDAEVIWTDVHWLNIWWRMICHALNGTNWPRKKDLQMFVCSKLILWYRAIGHHEQILFDWCINAQKRWLKLHWVQCELLVGMTLVRKPDVANTYSDVVWSFCNLRGCF